MSNPSRILNPFLRRPSVHNIVLISSLPTSTVLPIPSLAVPSFHIRNFSLPRLNPVVAGTPRPRLLRKLHPIPRAMAAKWTMPRGYGDHKNPPPPSPSSSIILISPTNQVLLMHRTRTSSAFPSAHVFPGGNLEPADGELPSSHTDPLRHTDNLAYRTGAIRELFEESGILLAKPHASSHRLLEVTAKERAAARKAVHSGTKPFHQWLKEQSSDAVLDTGGLIPFTHWITPPNQTKRFTTQMYLYFVHLRETGNPSINATSDEVETMTAEWRGAADWLSSARTGEIILFPPQFLLLYFVSQFLDDVKGGSAYTTNKSEEIVRRRRALYDFVTKDGSPPWREKFISPIGLAMNRTDGRQVLGLDKPGPELKDSGLTGDDTRVVLVKFQKEGPRQVEVMMRKEAMEQNRQEQASKL